MIDTAQSDKKVSRYLRNRMPAEEAERFELELLESPELQDELEVQLAIRQALQQEPAPEAPREETGTRYAALRRTWQHWALAASVSVALVAGWFYLKSEQEIAALRDQLDSLDALAGHVRIIPVDLMRSTGGTTPDVVVKRPAERTLMVLDIELNPDAAMHSTLNATLRTAEGGEVAAWTDSEVTNQTISLGLDSEVVSNALYRLEIYTPDGEQVDRRLLEFR